MKITITPGIVTLPPSRTPRTKGVHVSGIIRCIALETGILKMGDAEELDLLEVNPSTRFDDPMVCLRICMGLAWEEWYIPQLPEVMDHPGEMVQSEIYMSPDGLEMTTFLTDRGEENRVVVHEVKLTYKSIRTVGLTMEALALIKQSYPGVRIPVVDNAPLKEQWLWMAQLKSYCKANYTRHAKLHVLFVCGDYTYPLQPAMVIYEIEFTEQEIEDNWELIEDYRDIRIEIETRYRDGSTA